MTSIPLASRTSVLYLGPAEMEQHVRECLPNSFEIRSVSSDESIEGQLGDVEVILDASMRVRFNAETLQAADRLRLFVTATTGADHVDTQALAARGVPLLTLAGRTEVTRDLTPAAEHSWLLLLACARQLRSAMAGALGGEWDRSRYPGQMLRGRTLGLIGCGRIGRWMAHYGAAFGMTCIGFDPHVRPWPHGIEQCSMERVLTDSDFLSIHVPLSEGTHRLLDEPQLRQVTPGLVLINTSRGEVIDDQALLRALEDGRIGAAGLDVLAGEPDVETHPLIAYARRHENVVITPHIGGFSPDAVRVVLTDACQRIVDHWGSDL